MGLALFATCFSAKAQISASDWMIGGGARFFATSLAGEVTANAEISANVAYLFQLDGKGTKKNKGTIALGLQPSFSWDPLNDHYKAVVFARYYYNFERVSPFVEANIGYNLVNTCEDVNGELFAYTESLVLGAKAGSAFYISQHVTFDAYFFYDNFESTTHIQNPEQVSSNTQYTFGLGLGFQIFLQCKK